MPKKIELSDIIKNNPHIDQKRLSESMEALEKLRNSGVSGRRYELVPPQGGRRAHVADNSPDDPRITHLKRA